MADPRVVAVRADELVGVGTCTSIDEAFEDAELIEALDQAGVKTPEQAVQGARDLEERWLERGLDARWGEDDDPQLLLYNEFVKKRKELER